MTTKKLKIKLFGNKTDALFDYWSFGHATIYFLLSYFYLGKFPLETAMLIFVFLAYSWELIERSLEEFHHTKHFFKEKECWWNRYVGDLLSGLIGFFAGYTLF